MDLDVASQRAAKRTGFPSQEERPCWASELSASSLEFSMRVYLIGDNQVAALANAPAQIPENNILIQSVKDLDSRRFPVGRLIQLWNALPGATLIKKFQNRDIAMKRFWAALEQLPLSSPRSDSKQAQIIALLRRPDGASIDELMSVTGWQRHTVRGVLSGTLRKKLGLAIESVRTPDSCIYRILPA
jgi:hypothetical protein